MRNGLVSERPTLELRTDESDCSSWPTPKVATDDYSYASGDKTRPVLNLEGAAKMWPTPDAGAINDGNDPENFNRRKAKNQAKYANGNGMGTPLAMAATLWNTPNAHDGRRPGADERSTQGTNLSRQAPRTPMAGDGTPVLNPAFVEALMGLPPDWTVCDVSATPSSPHKPRSRGASSQKG